MIDMITHINSTICDNHDVYLIAFSNHAGHRKVAPRESDVHSRWKPAREQKKKEGEEEQERKTKTKPQSGSGLCSKVCCSCPIDPIPN